MPFEILILRLAAARWTIARADGKEIIMRKSHFQVTAGAQDYEATVTAIQGPAARGESRHA